MKYIDLIKDPLNPWLFQNNNLKEEDLYKIRLNKCNISLAEISRNRFSTNIVYVLINDPEVTTDIKQTFDILPEEIEASCYFELLLELLNRKHFIEAEGIFKILIKERDF